MAATYLIGQHLRAIALSKTPAAIADHKLCVEASRRANDERKKRFKKVTPDNFEAAANFFNARLEFWKKNLAT